MDKQIAPTVNEYFKNFPAEVQEKLHRIRNIIFELAPDAEEKIAYAMPAFQTHGRPLVYFAAFKNHIGLYATPSGHAQFAQELSQYKQGKGSVQFLHNKPLPTDLISRIVEFRVHENEARLK
jgi:uncharacterized protein YdhG (YjbR/CyaY superfamily)